MKTAAIQKFDTNVIKRVNTVLKYAHKECSLYDNLPLSIHSAEEFSNLPITTKKMLQEYSLTHYPLKQTNIYFVPSQFNTNKPGDMFLLPQHIGTKLNMLDQAIRRFNPQAVMNILPRWWQLGTILNTTCQYSNSPITVIQPTNLPLAREVLRQVGVQGIVTTPEIATKFSALLKHIKLKKPILFWHLVTRLDDISSFSPNDSSISFVEKQFMPSFTLAYQCIELASSNSNVFHPTNDFLWEIKENSLLLTSLKIGAFSFFRYRLDTNVIWKTKQCICGNNIIVQF